MPKPCVPAHGGAMPAAEPLIPDLRRRRLLALLPAAAIGGSVGFASITAVAAAATKEEPPELARLRELELLHEDVASREEKARDESSRLYQAVQEIPPTVPHEEPTLVIPAGASRSTRYRRTKIYRQAKADWESAAATGRAMMAAYNRKKVLTAELDQIRESVGAIKATSLDGVKIKAKILVPRWCRRGFVDDLLALGGQS
jgi:hypothetical protein